MNRGCDSARLGYKTPIMLDKFLAMNTAIFEDLGIEFYIAEEMDFIFPLM